MLIIKALVSYAVQANLLDSNFDIKENDRYLLQNCFIKKFSEKIEHNIYEEYERNLKDSDSLIVLNLIKAAVRTNFLLEKTYISIKFIFTKSHNLESSLIETFVYSEDFEAIHIRDSRVSRGGIRWSNRSDFRNEIFALQQTQSIKNCVIVPSGAKGGFILKKNIDNKEFAIECYCNFIRGLLDITDNIKGQVIKANCVCYDGDDYYLVVAADKGTASFSDYANSISKEYNFWLSDAFASGGSNGYNHKDLAITAESTWACIDRHLHDLGINIYRANPDNITTIALGSMAGDVAGNGLIHSDRIILLSAIDSTHIFLDPKPDNVISFQERLRLFNEGKKWKDYDKNLISRGGGVFERSSKSIKLSNEIRQCFDTLQDYDTISGSDLIKKLLMAEVDMIFNGAIGTFVKASYENDNDVNDSSCDEIRVNAKDLKAKIFAEGGNLGMTMAARVEYALAGGKVNADFIDNAGGVTCSDYEVNIKIALMSLPIEKRNGVIKDLTYAVCQAVLHSSKMQSQVLSLEEFLLEKHDSDFNRVEKISALIEFLKEKNIIPLHLLPKQEYMINRKASQQVPITRPELALLLSYTKVFLYREILNSHLPDQKEFEFFLLNYFPQKISHFYRNEVLAHRLKREIISTAVANDIVNNMGLTDLFFAANQKKCSIVDIIFIYYTNRHLKQDLSIYYNFLASNRVKLYC
jgi:glutamate dehydrogenase